MKWFVFFSIVLACTTSGTAQFIPQPMGYNPDENGDDLIGVNDLQGLLALYGQPFNNGDSIVTLSINFPADYDEWYTTTSVAVVEIPDTLDIIYLHQEDDLHVKFDLPQGAGYKSLQFFCSCGQTTAYQIPISFYSPTGNLILEQLRCQKPTYYHFLRGENGVWYRTRIDSND